MRATLAALSAVLLLCGCGIDPQPRPEGSASRHRRPPRRDRAVTPGIRG
ncbi:hypothetical protein [Blastococcus brunescens]|uniref:Uncharacterized protein n=1 Tax=Blastococcus brunescens TaxID=1564165 RepID=A0ABZ1B6K8_9ACTN|nr:hypothetical protein [Blastococcus sp. BMG 8361]WRL66374.1 hypothetical protein U6N30_13600 [Blastococcus sp. BMG 8361]